MGGAGGGAMWMRVGPREDAAGGGGGRGHTLVGHKGRVFAAAFEPGPGPGGDGDGAPLLASASEDGTVRFWGLLEAAGGPQFKSRGRVQVSAEEVLCLGWAPQGRLLASGGADGTVRVWDVGAAAGGGRTERGHGPEGPSASGSDGGAVEANEVLKIEFADQVYESQLLDEGTLLTASGDEAGVWDFQGGSAPTPLATVKCSLIGAAFGGERNAAGRADVFGVAAGDGKLAIANSDGTVRLHCSRTGAALACLHCGGTSPVTKCVFVSDGHTVAAGTGEGNIILHDLRKPGFPVGVVNDGHERAVYDMLSWAARPGWLLSCSSDCKVKAWDVGGEAPFRELASFSRADYPFHSISADPSGRWLALGGGQSGFLGTPLYVYDLQEGPEFL